MSSSTVPSVSSDSSKSIQHTAASAATLDSYTTVAEFVLSVVSPEHKVSPPSSSSTTTTTTLELCKCITLWQKETRRPVMLLYPFSWDGKTPFDRMSISVPSDYFTNPEIVRIFPEEIAFIKYTNVSQQLSITSITNSITLTLAMPPNGIVLNNWSKKSWRRLARRLVMDVVRYLEGGSEDSSNSDSPTTLQPFVMVAGKVKLPNQQDLLNMAKTVHKYKENSVYITDKTTRNPSVSSVTGTQVEMTAESDAKKLAKQDAETGGAGESLPPLLLVQPSNPGIVSCSANGNNNNASLLLPPQPTLPHGTTTTTTATDSNSNNNTPSEHNNRSFKNNKRHSVKPSGAKHQQHASSSSSPSSPPGSVSISERSRASSTKSGNSAAFTTVPPLPPTCGSSIYTTNVSTARSDDMPIIHSKNALGQSNCSDSNPTTSSSISSQSAVSGATDDSIRHHHDHAMPQYVASTATSTSPSSSSIAYYSMGNGGISLSPGNGSPMMMPYAGVFTTTAATTTTTMPSSNQYLYATYNPNNNESSRPTLHPSLYSYPYVSSDTSHQQQQQYGSIVMVPSYTPHYIPAGGVTYSPTSPTSTTTTSTTSSGSNQSGSYLFVAYQPVTQNQLQQ